MTQTDVENIERSKDNWKKSTWRSIIIIMVTRNERNIIHNSCLHDEFFLSQLLHEFPKHEIIWKLIEARNKIYAPSSSTK